GDNFTGDTACTDSGTVCTFVNQWYSQCLPGTASAPATSTTTIPTSTTSTTTAPPASTNAAGCSGTLTKFQFFGVNESGAEFGNQNIPASSFISSCKFEIICKSL
ncbi:hypothetical protein E4T56_gene20082, partial [Termitomyces sp. T112]